MLVLTRRSEEGILIFPDDTQDLAITIAELFLSGPIKVIVKTTERNCIKVGIEAPQGLKILREELVELEPIPK